MALKKVATVVLTLAVMFVFSTSRLDAHDHYLWMDWYEGWAYSYNSLYAYEEVDYYIDYTFENEADYYAGMTGADSYDVLQTDEYAYYTLYDVWECHLTRAYYVVFHYPD